MSEPCQFDRFLNSYTSESIQVFGKAVKLSFGNSAKPEVDVRPGGSSQPFVAVARGAYRDRSACKSESWGSQHAPNKLYPLKPVPLRGIWGKATDTVCKKRRTQRRKVHAHIYETRTRNGAIKFRKYGPENYELQLLLLLTVWFIKGLVHYWPRSNLVGSSRTPH